MNSPAQFAAALLVAVLNSAMVVAQEKIDTALPSLLSYERPQFPAKLRAESLTKGYATVAFTLRDDGRIDDAVVLEASHLEFGEAVVAVMPTWRFKSGEAGTRREVLRFEFQAQSALASLSYLDGQKKQFAASSEPKAVRTIQRPQLDSPPQRVTTVVSEVKTSGEGGTVSVSFVIDTDGRARVPTIVGAGDSQLGRTAIETVKQWRFVPSIYENAPVLVEDLRTLTFAPQSAEK